jgi:uncharacterized membrane protein YhhN
MLITILSGFTSISALLCILGKYLKTKTLIYIFKPLTTILIIVIALVASSKLTGNFKYILYLALIFSLIGDILLIFEDKFVQGLTSFFVAQALFLIGFLLLGKGYHWWLFTIFTTVAIISYSGLLPYLGKMKLPVLLYIALISAMAWRAWENWYLFRDTATILLAFGSVFYMISDLNFAINKFIKKYISAEAIILSTYFSAIWLISISLNFM